MIVWVSGASSGLGYHTSLQLKKAGMTVISGARSYRDQEGEAENGYRLYLDVKEKASMDRFKEQAGISDQVHPYYDRTINGVHLILMGPDSYPESSWEHFGVSAEEIEWLDNLIDVDQNKEQLSFVFMHEPLYETVRNTQPGDWGHEWSLSDQDNFNLHDCIKKHPNVIFFTGHTHALPDTVQLDDEEPLYVGTGSIAYCIDDVDDDSTGNADIEEYGSLGWEVTVWETCIRFRMRDFIKREFTDLESAIYQF